MENQQLVIMAVVVGMVVGFVSALFIARLKAVALKVTAEKLKEPATTKVKRAGKSKATNNLSVNKNTVSATSASNATKKSGGRTVKSKTLTMKSPATKEAVSVMKRRPGRPTNAELAARQTAAVNSAKSKLSLNNKSESQSPVTPNQQLLLDKLLNLSPEQLHALAGMPIGTATSELTTESSTA